MYFDPAFSVYDIIKKQHPSNIFLTELDYMYHLSRVIERDVLTHQLDAPFYVGFQSIDKLLPILERYKQISDVTKETVVFGKPSPEVCTVPGLNFVHIAAHSKLAKEWFLVIHHPDYSRVLAAREVTPPSGEESEREFEAIMTYEPDIVRCVADSIAGALMPYEVDVV